MAHVGKAAESCRAAGQRLLQPVRKPYYGPTLALTPRMAKTLLTPKDLADAIGTSESSMRRWIDSGRVRMSRTAGGHRRIELPEALRFIRDMGLPVVRPDILGLGPTLAGREAGEGDPGAPLASDQSDDERLYGALAAGDRALARALIVSWYLAGRSLAAIFDGAVRGALERLGELWTRDRGGILTEHRATDICIESIHHLRGLLPTPAPEASVALGATPTDEWHVVPSLMAASVAHEAGLRDINYGGNVPSDLLAAAAVEHRAKLVWLSITMPPRRGLRAELSRLASDLAAHGATLVIGGRHAPTACPAKHPNIHCVQSMGELTSFIRGMSK